MSSFGKILSLFPLWAFAADLVIGQTLGQMGNNLFQVATASALAWDHGAEAYFPRLEHTPTLRQHLFSRCHIYPPHESATEWHEMGYRYHPIPYQPDIELFGYFQSPKYFEHQRAKLLDLFAPTARDQRYLETKYDWLITHPNTVGIQIRYYLDDPKGEIFIQYGRDYLEKAMALFPPDALFIVSSNNVEFAKENLTGKKVTFLEGEPFYIDFYLLSLCKHNIITNSTFGWWAAWLNQNPDKQVICPRVWFRGYDTSDLCPDSWIQIDAKQGRISDENSY